MSGTLVLIGLAGHVALLLWGLHMVKSGILRAYGVDLRRVLGAGLKHRFTAFLSGLGVTAILQSSTATALMTASFTAGGVVNLAPALAIMLGADVGTTLIVQALSFNVSFISPLLILAGVTAFKRGGRTRTRDLGRVAIGLGLMLLALHLLLATLEPVEASDTVATIFAAITDEPLLAVLIAAAMTWAIHSSVAMVLLIASFAAAGILTPPAALALVLGANLGATLPALISNLGPNPADRRMPVGNLAFRAVGCLAALPFLPEIAGALALLGPGAGRAAVNFHTAFNIALAIVFLPLLGPVSRLLIRFFPEQERQADPATPHYLDEGALKTPYIALSNAARESMRMADVVETMLRGSLEVFHSDDRKRVAEISRMDNILDRLHGAIKLYLTEMTLDQLSDQDRRRCSEILVFTTNLEQAGDVIDKNLMELAAKKIKRQLSFSQEGMAEIDDLHGRLLDNMQLAIAVFMNGDSRSARRLLTEKEAFRDLERAATDSHFGRLRDGRAASMETSALHLDILRDLKRVNSHLAATAYPILDQTGELRHSRLRDRQEAQG